MDEEQEDIVFKDKAEALKYVNALCANIQDKRIRRSTRKKLLYNLRNKYGDIV
jgi:hypothetical protein